jgi:hypothetical protein
MESREENLRQRFMDDRRRLGQHVRHTNLRAVAAQADCAAKGGERPEFHDEGGDRVSNAEPSEGAAKDRLECRLEIEWQN